MTDEREHEFEAMKVELNHYKLWVDGLITQIATRDAELVHANYQVRAASDHLDQIQLILDKRWE